MNPRPDSTSIPRNVAKRILPTRLKWLFAAAFVLGPATLFVLIAILSAPEIDIWINTGMCPGGPMDRLPASCGLLEFFSITILGGWVGGLVSLAIIAWWAACIVVLLVTVAVRSARAASQSAP